MSRQPKSDLISFVNWLMEEEFFTRKTAQVYASNVRQVLARVEVLTQEEVNRIFAELSEEQDYKFTSWKSAWKKFSQWGQTKDVSIPAPEVSRYSSSLPTLPDTVREVVIKLMRRGNRSKGVEGMGLPATIIERIQWKDVQPSLGGSNIQRVNDPRIKGGQLIIPKEWIDKLSEYAQIEGNASVALIPISPGGHDPYPAKALRREALSHKRSRM